MTPFRSENDPYMLHFDEIGSTHEWLFERMLDFKSRPVTVVSADHQASGKGQRGNTWASERRKNLLISVLLNNLSRPVNEAWLLNALLTLTVCDLCHIRGLSRQRIKWPNDIYVGQTKIAGVLTRNTVRENVLGSAVLSAGVNVNQEDFGPDLPNATSLYQLTGLSYDTLETRWLYISTFRTRLAQYLRDSEKLVSDFMDRLIGYNEFVPINKDGSTKLAMIENIKSDGELILRMEDNTLFMSSNVKFELPHA